MELSKLPVFHRHFIPYLNKHPHTPVSELLAPFKSFEGTFRKAYAQQPDHGALKDPLINTVPIFAGYEGDFRVCARNPGNEAESEKYIMPLELLGRKANIAPAVVPSFKGIKKNVDLFPESLLVGMDWSNVVAAGIPVVTALLPVPDKLLVLEKVPKPDDRDAYLRQRRAERQRPAISTYHRKRYQLAGNIKDQQPDDVAEWIEEEEVSNYYTFHAPYGPKFHAKKSTIIAHRGHCLEGPIDCFKPTSNMSLFVRDLFVDTCLFCMEKWLYTKDLLLNAEWNQNKDRKVNLHRHPCFSGSVDDILKDCCGQCPTRIGDEEMKIATEDWKISDSLKTTLDVRRSEVSTLLRRMIGPRWPTSAIQQGCVNLSSTATCNMFRIGASRRVLIPSIGAITQGALHYILLRWPAHLRGNTQIVRALLEKSEANEEAEARKAASMKAAAKAIFHNDEKDGLKVLQIKNASNNDEDDRSEGDDQSDDPVL
ncbi:MAG: hypothetical protein M1830_002152 [Pleopsidium flavum]|nr:MAG: hypothetical protein M1830_002152 [Pleopsidium flavum]